MDQNPSLTSFWKSWRSGRDSNPRPPAWQAGILTNWTTTPASEIFFALRKYWRSGRDSNPRPSAWQADILTNWTTTPSSEHIELSKELAEWTGLEPATPGVTGRYSNQLNYHSTKKQSIIQFSNSKALAEWTGLEPATPGVTGRYSNQLNYHSIGI